MMRIERQIQWDKKCLVYCGPERCNCGAGASLGGIIMTENSEGRPMRFDNGLTSEEDSRIDDLMIAIINLRLEIESFGPHRSYSLAITKLEEALHWLRDRKNKPGQIQRVVQRADGSRES